MQTVLFGAGADWQDGSRSSSEAFADSVPGETCNLTTRNIALGPPLLDDHRLQRLESVGFLSRFVPANAADAREAHGHARFMPRRAMHRIEGHLEHELGLDLADGAETVHRMIAHEGIELSQLLIREAEIRLADRHELGLSVLGRAPSAERIVRIIRRALAASPLRIHEHGIEREWRAFPFVPMALGAPGDIGAVAPLEHQPLDAGLA